MLMRTAITGIATFLIATPALAAADIRVEIQSISAHVYDTTDYQIEVANIGNKRANAVELVIELPETNTSPQVYVMGVTSGVDPRCTAVGTELHCQLGDINKNAATTIAFGIDLPQADEELAVTATASSSSAENSLANNVAVGVATLLNYAISVNAGSTAHNRHCTGQGLTSFYECELFPSSISSHDVDLLAGGVLSIPGQPDFTGTWSQPTTERLVMVYEEIGYGVVAEFDGYGVSSNCFEGMTTFFPSSPYVAPYEVCF